MEISLKRAAKLINLTQAAIAQIKFEPTAATTLYNPLAVGEVARVAKARLTESLDSLRTLNAAVYEIRKLRGIACDRGGAEGVSFVLTRINEVEALIKSLGSLVKQVEDSQAAYGRAQSADAVEATILANRKRAEERDVRVSEDYTVQIMDEEDLKTLQDEIAGLRRLKADLDDRRTSMNAVEKITLSAATVATLHKHKIID